MRKPCGDETEPIEGDETKPIEGDETEPIEGDETEPIEGDETEPSEWGFTHDSDTVSVPVISTVFDGTGGQTTPLEAVAPAHWLPFYAAFTCAMTAVVLMIIYTSVVTFHIAAHGGWDFL
jgi:hypothetical protein